MTVEEPSAGLVRNADPATYELVYAEALRSITQQQAVLDELRGRAATVLSAAAIVTGFLGGIALDDAKVGIIGAAAIIVFAIAGFLCVVVLLPWPGWNFRWNIHDLLANYVEDPTSPATKAEMQRDLAYWAEEDYQSNASRIAVLWWLLRAAAALLVTDVILWLIELSRLGV